MTLGQPCGDGTYEGHTYLICYCSDIEKSKSGWVDREKKKSNLLEIRMTQRVPRACACLSSFRAYA